MITSLAATYSGAGLAAGAPRLGLEQEPMADNSLTLDDLEQMLALVRSGVSARTYRPASCPASVVEGSVLVPLDLWVWPVPIDLPYTLTPNQGDLGAAIAVSIEREFDLVIDFQRRVELPFATSAISWQWTGIPCFDRMSNEVPRPTVSAEPDAIMVDTEILGVLRIKCTAVGYLHTLQLEFVKGTNAITDVHCAVTASWQVNGEPMTANLPLDLPACAAQLLETCEGGQLVRERALGSVSREKPLRTVVYYNDCDGSELAVRHERA